jgi:hypothetical protein
MIFHRLPGLFCVFLVATIMACFWSHFVFWAGCYNSNSCYFTAKASRWHEGRNRCLSNNGDLAVLTTDHFRNNPFGLNSSNFYYIGLSNFRWFWNYFGNKKLAFFASFCNKSGWVLKLVACFYLFVTYVSSLQTFDTNLALKYCVFVPFFCSIAPLVQSKLYLNTYLH